MHVYSYQQCICMRVPVSHAPDNICDCLSKFSHSSRYTELSCGSSFHFVLFCCVSIFFVRFHAQTLEFNAVA